MYDVCSLCILVWVCIYIRVCSAHGTYHEFIPCTYDTVVILGQHECRGVIVTDLLRQSCTYTLKTADMTYYLRKTADMHLLSAKNSRHALTICEMQAVRPRLSSAGAVTQPTPAAGLMTASHPILPTHPTAQTWKILGRRSLRRTFAWTTTSALSATSPL